RCRRPPPRPRPASGDRGAGASRRRALAAPPRTSRAAPPAPGRRRRPGWPATRCPLGSPSSEMRVKQRIARLLIHEIIANTDEPTREIVLVIHWVGGRHFEVRIP